MPEILAFLLCRYMYLTYRLVDILRARQESNIQCSALLDLSPTELLHIPRVNIEPR